MPNDCLLNEKEMEWLHHYFAAGRSDQEILGYMTSWKSKDNEHNWTLELVAEKRRQMAY
jgi:hypothetical protein